MESNCEWCRLDNEEQLVSDIPVNDFKVFVSIRELRPRDIYFYCARACCFEVKMDFTGGYFLLAFSALVRNLVVNNSFVL